MNRRREFLTQVGAFAALTSFDANELKAASAAPAGAWDTSWIEALAPATYRVVFNAEGIADGSALATRGPARRNVYKPQMETLRAGADLLAAKGHR